MREQILPARSVAASVVRVLLILTAGFAALNVSDTMRQELRDAGARSEFAEQQNDFVRMHASGLLARNIAVTLLAPSQQVTCSRYLEAFDREEPAKRAELLERGYDTISCGSRVEKIEK